MKGEELNLGGGIDPAFSADRLREQGHEVKVGLALSGGVDSAVAAHLLLEQGYKVEAWHMLLPEFREGRWSVNPDRQADARRVAEQFGIPFHTIDLTEAFMREVIQPVITAYAEGKTPNPCALCNPAIKFGALFDAMRAKGFDHIATGHYARIGTDPRTGALAIYPAADAQKDQSYFLYRIPLYGILFPIGGLLRSDVRALAEKIGLSISQKKSSQDLCFLPEGDYRPLLPENVLVPGPVVNTGGKPIGTHQGIASCTIGQRKGIGIATGERAYVVEIRPETNTIVAGSRDDLKCSEFTVLNMNSIINPGSIPIRAEARTRYHKPLFPVSLFPLPSGDCRVVCDEPQEAIAPGQACVFYRDGFIIGGGSIARGNEIRFLYTLLAPFEDSEAYIARSHITQLTELVSLDHLLCPELCEPDYNSAEDWKYIHTNQSHITHFYTSREYVLRNAAGLNRFHFLAVVIDPGRECREIGPEGFEFAGYELLDLGFAISVLNDCFSTDPDQPSAYPLAFDIHELNSHGLIDDYARAAEIRDALHKHYPEDGHAADVTIFAVWRHCNLGRT